MRAFLHTNKCLLQYLMSVSLIQYNYRNNRLAYTCRVSNFSPIWTSMKKVGRRGANHLATRETAYVFYLALKIGYINKTHTYTKWKWKLFISLLTDYCYVSAPLIPTFFMDVQAGLPGKYRQAYCSYCIRETLIRYGGMHLLVWRKALFSVV